MNREGCFMLVLLGFTVHPSGLGAVFRANLYPSLVLGRSCVLCCGFDPKQSKMWCVSRFFYLKFLGLELKVNVGIKKHLSERSESKSHSQECGIS